MSVPPTEREEFRIFIIERINRVVSKKPLCRIILFGSYHPPSEKQLLFRIRDSLRDDGYENTWIVEDYPNYTDLEIRDKSIACLEFSHINFFIATIDGEKGGWTVELEHVIHSATNLSFKTVVFHEIKSIGGSEIDALSILQKDGLRSVNVKMISFDKDDYNDLFGLIRGEAWRLHYYYSIYENSY